MAGRVWWLTAACATWLSWPLPWASAHWPLMPLPTEKRNRGEGQRDVAVLIQGVWVRPGDWLYADEDGIVVSAQALTT
jgi:hypothetical protein